MSKIALFGAAGAIGRSIADALRAQQRPYRVVGRQAAALHATFGADPLAELATWDPDSPDSIRAAASGIDTLVYLVGVDYWRFELHPALMQRTIDGAVAAGVKRIVLIGTVYPYGRSRGNPVREDHPRTPHTFKGRMRLEQEQRLMQAHADGRIEATVLRLPDFYGPGVTASLLHGAIRAAVAGGPADLLGPLDREHEFVFVPDVGPVLTRLIDTPGAWGRIWHLGGAGVTTQRALLDEIERQTGRKLRPRVANKTMLRVLGLFKPMMRELVEMNYLMTEPLILDDSALQALIGPIRKTPYAEGLRRSLAAQAETAAAAPAPTSRERA